MTINERQFVNNYIETLDDKKAQKDAGIHPYDPSLLSRPDINRLISQKLQEHFATLDITDEYILANIKQVFEDASRPVPRVKIDKYGDQIYYQTQDGKPIMDIDRSSQLKALELLGRYRSLFTDRQSVDVTTDFEKYISTAQDKEEW